MGRGLDTPGRVFKERVKNCLKVEVESSTYNTLSCAEFLCVCVCVCVYRERERLYSKEPPFDTATRKLVKIMVMSLDEVIYQHGKETETRCRHMSIQAHTWAHL